MLKTIRKIKQSCRSTMRRYREIKDKIQKQKILSEMEKAGIIVL